MALKSTEIIVGNYSRTPGRNFSSSHTGIDWLTPKNTQLKSRFPGKIYRNGKNPPGQDFGNYTVVKYSNRIYGWYAHLNAFKKKLGAAVKQGEVIALSGNSGYVLPKPTPKTPNSGSHLHYSESANISGKIKWLDPDKTKVKEVEADVYKDTSGIFNVTLSAAGWNKSAVRYYKDYKATLAKLNSVTNKVKDLEASIDKKIITATVDATKQYQTFINQQTQKYDKTISDLQGELEGCRGRGVQLTTEVENLKGQLNIAVEPDKPAIPRVRATDGFWTRAWKRVLQGIAK